MFIFHPWRRFGTLRAVRTPKRHKSRAPAPEGQQASSLELTGAQRARLRITALSGLQDHDKLDLPQVAPKNAEN